MTVAELIKILQEFSPDLLVVGHGCDETEYEDCAMPEVVQVMYHNEAPILHSGRRYPLDSWRAKGMGFTVQGAVLINFSGGEG